MGKGACFFVFFCFLNKEAGRKSGGGPSSSHMIPFNPQFHLLARRGSLPLLMVTEDFAVVGGPATAA